MKSFKSFQELTETCWPGYKQVGTKKKNGKEVPNCVPEENDVVEVNSKDIRDKLKKVKGISKKQIELIATLPSPMLTSIVQQLSSLVASKDHCDCDPIEEAPLVMNDMDIVRSILKKIEDDFSKLYTKKQFERGWPKLQMIAKAAGYGISKSKQPQGKTYRYDLKK